MQGEDVALKSLVFLRKIWNERGGPISKDFILLMDIYFSKKVNVSEILELIF